MILWDGCSLCRKAMRPHPPHTAEDVTRCKDAGLAPRTGELEYLWSVSSPLLSP